MIKYTNRYNDIHAFELDADQNVIWKGNFHHCRLSWPNVYSEAYQQYRKDGGDMHIEWFKEEVHKYDPETFKPSDISEKYRSLVYSDMNTIAMVDPSGGPYMASDMDLGSFLGEEFTGRCVRSFESIEDDNWKIITYDKYEHLADYRSTATLEDYEQDKQG